MFAEYIYTGDFTIHDTVSLVELFDAGKLFGFRDPAELDYLAYTALDRTINSSNVRSVRERAQQLKVTQISRLTDTVIDTEEISFV